MRHNVAGRKLGRKTGHRLALFRNQLASLVASERIVTTLAKAKELRPLAERVVTHGKRGSIHARRMVGRWLPNRDLVKKLFDEIAPRFAERPGGYLRIVKLGARQGDGAELAVLEFVDFVEKKATPPAERGREKDNKGAEPAAGEETKEAKPKEKAARPPAASSTAPAKATKKGAAPKSEGKAHTAKAAAGPKKGSAPKKIGSS
jgi:large subunit ribosomal protein L17